LAKPPKELTSLANRNLKSFATSVITYSKRVGSQKSNTIAGPMYSEPMKSFTDNYFDLVHILMIKVATVAAFVVAVVTFAFKGARQWYTNGGQESIALFTMKVLQFINSLSESLYYSVEETVDKPREV